MALPEALSAYEDCYEYYDRAQNSAKGIRIAVHNREAAVYLRMRLNQARALERREARRTYPISDPRHGKSANDCFRVTFHPCADGEPGFWVYIERWVHTADRAEIEELE